jgi:hypothetical protein
MWEAILEAFCRVQMQPAEFRTLMQVPGTLARWIREESGLQVSEFNPPRINNLSRLQDIIDQEREESLEVLSRHSMPNVEYEEPEVISNAAYRRAGFRFTTDNVGAQVRIGAELPVARQLSMEEVVSKTHANTQDCDEGNVPAEAEVVGIGSPRQRRYTAFRHQASAYESVAQLEEGCRIHGQTVLPAASHLLRNFNLDALEIVPLDLSQMPESSPIQFAPEPIQNRVQEATHFNDDLYEVLMLQVLHPFVQTHLPLATWRIFNEIGITTAREAIQIANVPSQLLRRIRELDLQVIDVKPPQPEELPDPVLQLETNEEFKMILVLQTEIRQDESAGAFFAEMTAYGWPVCILRSGVASLRSITCFQTSVKKSIHVRE